MTNDGVTDTAAYAGRWIALIGNRVVGVGHTAEEALHLALRNRPKERVRLHFVERPDGKPLPASPLLARVRPLLADHPLPVYLVGGAVRDLLLGAQSHDLDFVVSHGAIKLAFAVADELGVPAYVLDRERDTGRVMIASGRTTLDFAGFRGPDLDADLKDRDFTINAMALPVTARQISSIIDPCDGMADLSSRLIRLTHRLAINADPVRALRAIRLAIGLDYAMTDETVEAIVRAAGALSRVSVERVRDELVKLLQTPRPHDGITLLAEFGLLVVAIPEVAALSEIAEPSRGAELAHTISVLRWLTLIEEAITSETPIETDALETATSALARYRTPLTDHLEREVDGGLNGRLLLRLGALFHDVGKKDSRSIDPVGNKDDLGPDRLGARLTAGRLRSMHFSSQAIEHVQRIVAGHMHLISITRGRPLESGEPRLLEGRTVYRYFRDTRSAGIDIGLITLAKYLATHEGIGDAERWNLLLAHLAELFHHYFENHAKTVAPQPLVNGRELMDALGLEPGPEIGRLLRTIEEAQAAGEVTSRAEVLRYARLRHQERPAVKNDFGSGGSLRN